MNSDVFCELFYLINCGADLKNFFDRIDTELNTYEEPKRFDDVFYKRLQLAQCAMMLSISKEECMTKKNKSSLSSNVSDEYLEIIISKIAPKDENGLYTLGDFKYKSSLEVLDVLRNKLAHGDYLFSDDSIVFGDKSLTKNPEKFSKVKIDDICKAVVKLVGNEFFRNTRPNKRYSLVSAKIDNVPEIKDKRSFMQACDSIYILEIIDTPINNTPRDMNYTQTLNSFLNTMYATLQRAVKTNLPVQSVILKYKNLCNSELKKNGIDLSINCIKASKSSKISSAYKLYNNLHMDFELTTNEKKMLQYTKASQILLSMLNEDNSIDTIKSGLLNNYNQTENLINQTEIYQPLTGDFTYVDDTTIASSLVLYYLVFQYGLENIYSNSSNTSLNDIINGYSFDFSKLDIDELYDPNMKTLVSFKNIKTQYDSLRINYIKLMEAYEKALKNKENYLNNASTIDDAVVSSFDEKINNAKSVVDEIKDDINKADEFMNRFDDYVKNYNILLNIRDSIAHGNYELLGLLDPNEDTLRDRRLIFTNEYNGKVNYNLIIRYEDFNKIFKVNNIISIFEFLKTNSNLHFEYIIDDESRSDNSNKKTL